MKEINIYSSQNLKIRLILMNNAISIVEESTKKTQEKETHSLNYYNFTIKDIHNIKYVSHHETSKIQANLLCIILSVLLLIGGIVCIPFKLWSIMGILLFFSFVSLLIGLLSKKPSVNNFSHSLVIESENKILYSKNIQIEENVYLDIINSIRDRQVSNVLSAHCSEE